MANLEEFIGKMKNLSKDLEENFGDAILEGSITAKSLVQNRIQERGISSNNVPFGEYAESTKKIRKKEGKQIIFVDLTDSGEMWKRIGVVNEKKSKNFVAIKIGAKDEFTRKKLEDNTERFGPIMDLSITEEMDIVDTVDFEIGRIINRNLK